MYDGTSTVNVATLVPNGCVRMMVMGNTAEPADTDELEAMQEWCRQGMREGAVGLSSGLDYVPSGYADTAELAALAEAVAPFGGVYVTHVRYRLGLLPALEEAIEIGRLSGAPPHISHLMAEVEHGIAPEDVLAVIDGARAAGIDVTFDLYPYTFGCTTLLFVLPLWAREGDPAAVAGRLADPAVRERLRVEVEDDLGDWAEIEIAGALEERFAPLLGLDLVTAAREAGAHPVDLVCDLLVAHDLDVLLLGADVGDPARERALEPMLAHPAHMFGSDGVHARGRCHPRTYGGAARYLGRFVRERGALPFEEAVRHATSFPARRYGLADRGLVRPGFAADLVLLDPDALIDRSTREERLPADGVHDVWVNGVAVLRDGEITGATPGRGLRRGQSAGAGTPAFTQTDL
jgi:N-acyl-D-amino-acid deacylase